ncbi:MarR family winged helix-turn-helix transcriptional regulator [Sciscionella sediminilitoris]|uniref:MarR family winged helix-turn-helix transcriptional regulator n=1 Tax=Sciscionella sediminilitoris TaxID=1445613 RepID=UPI001E2D7253|nr:MarR family transcriptional regulator [Sciscionella sp. SE31]
MTSGTDRDMIDALIEAISAPHDAGTLEAKALSYRMRRIAHHLETRIRRELAPQGIELWELEMLACLRRADPDCRLSAGELMRQLQLTSGAVTNRVSRLTAKGWVTREVDEADRRSVSVVLTEEGRARAKAVFGGKTETEREVFSPLSREQQHRINEDLRTLLLALEGPVA